MSQKYLITHYYHSGFSVACGEVLLVFDYWRGEEENDLPEALQLTTDRLQTYRSVYVFISHEHMDHLDPIVFSWRESAPVTYIVSSDMPVGTRGRRMAPGDTFTPEEGVSVTAYDSTDLGVSFLVDFFGCRFFHAGDLNFWHWRDESSMKEIEEAEEEFRKAVQPIPSGQIDVAFFPLDPRQGAMFEAGANYFILSVKPRLLIPMHYFHRADVAVEYARTASNRSTEVLAMPEIGQRIGLEMEEDGYLNITLHPEEEPFKDVEEAEEETQGDMLAGDNPFFESDLPLAQLADETPESP